MNSSLSPERTADFALIPPVLNTLPPPEYSYDKLDYGMTIGIERTRRGRLWVCWVGGGDNAEAYFVFATSDDAGTTWSDPRMVIDPHDSNLPDKRRTLVGNLWLDPLGRLWLFFDQAMSYFDGRAGLWAARCDDPDADHPTWTSPKRIWHGCALNKPSVLKNGEWLLPISLWNRGRITDFYKGAFSELDPCRLVNVFVSADQGENWQRRGGIGFPSPAFDEPQVIERSDGSLWMTARTDLGLWESFSTDHGITWSEPVASSIANVSSRHLLRRLRSGRLLLIKHGTLSDQRPETPEGATVRSHLTAFLSDDEGATWQGGLLLDERAPISYPDGLQLDDETILVSYDYDRDLHGHILLARFKESDVLAGQLVEEGSLLRSLICQSNPEAVNARLERKARERANA
jgi:hypothetical protein